eukprot:838967-Rhodomonas_salina.3
MRCPVLTCKRPGQHVPYDTPTGNNRLLQLRRSPSRYASPTAALRDVRYWHEPGICHVMSGSDMGHPRPAAHYPRTWAGDGGESGRVWEVGGESA